MVIFDEVLVLWEREFYAEEREYSGALTNHYATHHRHSCSGARVGFGDLVIGAAP